MDSTIRHRSSPSSHLERMKLRSIVVTNTVTPSLNAARTRHGLFPAHHNPTTTKRTRTSSHFAEIIHFGISSPLRLAPPITARQSDPETRQTRSLGHFRSPANSRFELASPCSRQWNSKISGECSLIAKRQDSFETVLVHESTEAELLNRLSDIVAKLDPDVIEGHNILGFDVPYLIHRANHAGVELKLGRDGSAPRLLEGGRQPRVFIHGRHVIDTYQQIQRFDVAGRFSRYGLKEVIRQLGLERQDRTLVDRTRIVEIWRSGEHDRQVLADYALDDVRDVDTLSRIVMPTEFYQTQMLPVSYQRSSSIGTGRKIDELMLRSYLAAGHSIPSPSPSRPYPGGYVELIQTGAFGPVVKCDVESLYPSIMLRDAITSANDVLHAFPILLRDLTERRLDAKRRVLETSGEERETWHSLQASFKILINSFYGYLGFGVGAFND